MQEKNKFSFLVTLFLKVYEKNKEQCNKLIEIFYKINEEENSDKINDLKKKVKSFRDI